MPGNLLLPYLFFVAILRLSNRAVIVNQLYLSGALTKKQSNRFICFCNHASPAFLFNLSIIIIFAHSAAHGPCYFRLPFVCFVDCGLVLMIHSKDPFPQQANAAAKEQRLEDIFMESVSTIMKIGCFMLLFSIVIQISFLCFPNARSCLYPFLLPGDHKRRSHSIFLSVFHATKNSSDRSTLFLGAFAASLRYEVLCQKSCPYCIILFLNYVPVSRPCPYLSGCLN